MLGNGSPQFGGQAAPVPRTPVEHFPSGRGPSRHVALLRLLRRALPADADSVIANSKPGNRMGSIESNCRVPDRRAPRASCGGADFA